VVLCFVLSVWPGWRIRRPGFFFAHPSGVAVPRTPKDLAAKMAARRRPSDDGFRRETYALPLEEARARARAILKRYPKAAYMTSVESWRDLGDGRIEFTMKRLPSAD